MTFPDYLVLERPNGRTMAWMDLTPENLLLVKQCYELQYIRTSKTQQRYKIKRIKQ